MLTVDVSYGQIKLLLQKEKSKVENQMHMKKIK